MRRIRFAHRERLAFSIPWGDLATAYRSTGIPNITTYLAYPPDLIRLLCTFAPLARAAVSFRPGRRVMQAVAGRIAAGPGS